MIFSFFFFLKCFFISVFFLLFITKEGTGTDIVVYRENVEKEEL